MKNLRMQLLTVVGMTLGAAAAYGQVNLRANVPFAFRTTSGSLTAGRYAIQTAKTGPMEVIQITNVNTGHSIFALANQRVGVTTPANPRLVFRCGESSGCVLTEAYSANGSGWTLTTPRRISREKERMAVIYLHRDDAE